MAKSFDSSDVDLKPVGLEVLSACMTIITDDADVDCFFQVGAFDVVEKLANCACFGNVVFVCSIWSPRPRWVRLRLMDTLRN